MWGDIMPLEALTSMQEAMLGGIIGGGLIAALMAFFVVGFLFSIILYVYWAFAWMNIAKKFKYDKPWLAWIPIANLFLIPILAEKEWPWGFIFFVPIANLVFWIIWMWKIYEKSGFPGALSLIYLATFVPFLGRGSISGLAGIANLVIIGLIAWGKPPTKKNKK